MKAEIEVIDELLASLRAKKNPYAFVAVAIGNLCVARENLELETRRSANEADRLQAEGEEMLKKAAAARAQRDGSASAPAPQ